ncbi:MAG: hypothetical protein GX050_06465 [Firmicutes bacterium]|nr:hypothetical protein [Bacillota bacterium]
MPVFNPQEKGRKKFYLVGMLVKNRPEQAPDLQKIITEYGSDVIGRFGIPSADKQDGLIVLAMQEEEAVHGLTSKLEAFPGLQIQTVQFD